jgi:sugar O-acyltransferase (sialic acid O-acetyltransferase NeuD family)
MTEQQILIYGAGGFAREVAWLAESCSTSDAPISVVGFIDDNPTHHGQHINDLPVYDLQTAYQRFPSAAVVGGIGAPRTRQLVMERAADIGFATTTLIHPRTEMSRWIDICAGTVICAGNILTTNIHLGLHVQINLDCTIGHDVILGDYATLAPGVHVSGCVHVGKRVYIGTGAVIINGTAEEPLIIEDDAVVGAAACVTKPVSAGTTVVGIPAKPLTKA